MSQHVCEKQPKASGFLSQQTAFLPLQLKMDEGSLPLPIFHVCVSLST